MRVFVAAFLAVITSSCALSDPNEPSLHQDITGYYGGYWRSYIGYYQGTGHVRCDMSTTSVNSLPVRAFFRSSWPQAFVTIDTKTGEQGRIAFHVAYEQDPKSRPVAIINAREFALVAQGPYAYAADAKTELALLQAMKSNSQFRSKVVIKGMAKDGTATEDHFSMEAFEAHYKSMKEHCQPPQTKPSRS